MTLFKALNTLDALEDLLERERRLILTGDLDPLARLAPEKSRLLERMARAGGTAQAFERLRRKTERNQDLLLAAARGIRSAAARLTSPNPVQAPLRTYDRSGQAQTLSQSRSSLEKRS